jgi:hypothetical protein
MLNADPRKERSPKNNKTNKKHDLTTKKRSRFAGLEIRNDKAAKLA